MDDKIIKNNEFEIFLKNIASPDIFYFNKDMLQITYKDISGITLLLSSIHGDTSGGKISGSLFGVATIEGGSDKTVENEHIYSPKDLILQIFNDSKYSKYLKVLKVRIAEIGKTSHTIKPNRDGSITQEKTTYDSALRLLNHDTPRNAFERINHPKTYFEDTYVFLEPSYTTGLLKDFLFNRESFWYTTKPDIEADDFYLICLEPISFDSVRDTSEESKFYDLIYPLAVLRVKNKNIINSISQIQ